MKSVLLKLGQTNPDGTIIDKDCVINMDRILQNPIIVKDFSWSEPHIGKFKTIVKENDEYKVEGIKFFNKSLFIKFQFA